MLEMMIHKLERTYHGTRQAWQKLYHSEYNPEITLENTLGSKTADRLKAQPWYREGVMDTLSNITYSLGVGTALDTRMAHLDPWGLFASRGYATLVNAATGGPYGKYRNLIYKVTRTDPRKSGWKKTLADLFAFNTFQIPVYGSAIAIGMLLSEGSVDIERIMEGMKGLAILSPFIGPTMGWFQDKVRQYTGFKTAAEHAETEAKP